MAAGLSEVSLTPCVAVPAVPVPDGSPVSAQCCAASAPAPAGSVPCGCGRGVLPALPALPGVF